MSEIRCSACDAVVQPGNQFCPGCGLQLTARAIPAVYDRRPRFPGWYIAAVILLAFFGILYIGNQISADRQAKIDAAATATFHARYAALSAIDTPALFQARCGKALRVEKNPANLAPGTILLDYPAPAPPTVAAEDRGGDLIKFSFGPTLSAAVETYRGERRFFTDEQDTPGTFRALDRIGCKLQ